MRARIEEKPLFSAAICRWWMGAKSGDGVGFFMLVGAQQTLYAMDNAIAMEAYEEIDFLTELLCQGYL